MNSVRGSAQALLLMVVMGLMWGCGEGPEAPPPPEPPTDGAPPAALPPAQEGGSPPADGGGSAPPVSDSGPNVPPENVPPEIVESSQSSAEVSGGGAVTLRVSARSPREGRLEFRWQSQDGAFSTPVNTATTSEVRWVAPACGQVAVAPSLQVTVLDASGLPSWKSFKISIRCPQWSTVEDMPTPRHGHAACVLPSGKVIVTGRYGTAEGGKSVEEYDPATHTWSPKAGMQQGRRDHTASVLPSGKVLVTGGYNTTDNVLKSTEVYDPAAPSTAAWSSGGSMNEVRRAHTATVLPSGKVLVVGGQGVSGALASAELYDGEKWVRTGSMATGRYGHTATLLPSGQVLVVGGIGSPGALADAELYDPATGSWRPAGLLPGMQGRAYHTATVLPSGQVLVAGGWSSNESALADAALYDSSSGRWSQVGSLAMARANHTATLLASGQVLIVGGMNFVSLASAEVYDPASQKWMPWVPIHTARSQHIACLLPSGQVLVAGGHAGSGPLASAELYEP